MVTEKEIIRGGIGVTRDETLKTYLQTCCAILYYDKENLRGLAHAVVPSKFERFYRLGDTIPSDFIVTPEQAAVVLLEEIVKNGANRKNLNAGIFGCRQHVIGYENSLEAEKVVSGLNIPVVHRLTSTPYDIDLTLGPISILAKLIDTDSKNSVRNLYLPYR